MLTYNVKDLSYDENSGNGKVNSYPLFYMHILRQKSFYYKSIPQKNYPPKLIYLPQKKFIYQKFYLPKKSSYQKKIYLPKTSVYQIQLSSKNSLCRPKISPPKKNLNTKKIYPQKNYLPKTSYLLKNLSAKNSKY